jgi:hypothetical protein
MAVQCTRERPAAGTPSVPAQGHRVPYSSRCDARDQDATCSLQDEGSPVASVMSKTMAKLKREKTRAES